MKPTILIVEDELLIAMDIQGILEHEGYNVIINITSVSEAIQAIENYNPIMVLIDINLNNNEEEDGINLGRFLLNKNTIPYIYITSYSDNVTIERVKETRPYGMIIKPFKPIDIKTTVSIALSNYKLKNSSKNQKESIFLSDIPLAVREVVDYINENIGSKLDVQDIAKMTKWKYMHFIRIFTKYVGETPYQYILKKKIETAQQLIIDTEIPLSQIATDLGFASYSNFSNVFKRETGKIPTTLRKFTYVKKFLEP